MTITISKKIFNFIIGILCDVLVPWLLFFIAVPFFHIEGKINYGQLDLEDYFKPGNLFLLVIIPILLIATCSFFSYHFQIRKNDSHRVKPWIWLLFSILITIMDLFLIIVPEAMTGLIVYLSMSTIVWYCSIPIVGFNLFCLWKGYSLSLKNEKENSVPKIENSGEAYDK